MPDINEPTEAEIEAVKADQLWWQQVEEPLGLRLGGWTFRNHAQFFDISTGAVVELPGTVAERVIAAYQSTQGVQALSDINEPTEAEIEAAASALCKATGHEPDALEPGDLPRVDGYNRKGEPCHFLWRDFMNKAKIVLLAGRRVSSAPSFADGIEAAAKVADNAQKAWAASGDKEIIAASSGAFHVARDIRALAHNPKASIGVDEGKWLGPYKTAAEALDDCRKAVATEIGADPETWPDHGNAALAIAATVALARIRNRSGAAEGNEAEAAAPSLKDAILDAARHVRAQPAGLRGPYVIGDERLDGIIERLGPKSDASGAPKPDPAIAELVGRLEIAKSAIGRLRLDPGASAEDRKDRHAIDQAIAALTASNDRVAELERERDEARETFERFKKASEETIGYSYDAFQESERLRLTVEAEVSRLKAGAVTGWQSIESAPQDGSWIELWRSLPVGNGPYFEPLIIARWYTFDDGDEAWAWPDDVFEVWTPHGRQRAEEMMSAGDCYEDTKSFTHWRPLSAPPLSLSNQAGASK